MGFALTSGESYYAPPEQLCRGRAERGHHRSGRTVALPSAEWLRANAKQSWGFTNIAKVIARTGPLEGGRVRSSLSPCPRSQGCSNRQGKQTHKWRGSDCPLKRDNGQCADLSSYSLTTSLCLAFPICEMGSSLSNHTCIPVLLGPLEWCLALNIDHKKCHLLLPTIIFRPQIISVYFI